MTEDIFEAAIRRLGALPVARSWLDARIRGRHPFFGASLLIIVALTGAAPSSTIAQDVPGSTQSVAAQSGSASGTNTQIQPLTSFPSPNALACKAACDSNPNCQAWSWERMRSEPESERKKPSTKEGDKEKRSQGRERSDKNKKDKKDTDESDAQRQATQFGEGGTCTLFSSVEGQLNSSCVSGVKPGVPGAGPSPTTPPGGQPTPQPCPPGQVLSAQPASSSAPVLVDKLTMRQGPDVKVGNACMENACVDSTAVLEAGRQYVIEVSGLLLHDETNPSYKGYYDLDAVWAFGGNSALYSATTRFAVYDFLVDGKNMKDMSGQDVPYNPGHVYRVNYIGQGKRVTFNLVDDEGISEHPLGALTVAIYSSQGGTGCVPAPTQTAQGSQPTNPMYPGAPPPPPPAGENPFPPQPPPSGENPYPPTSPNPVGTPAPTPTSAPGGTTLTYCPPDPGLLDEKIIQALPDRFTEADTMVLQAGQQYVIEAAGVFGYWDTQKDGVDPVWCYAQWRCGKGQMWQSLQLDGKGMKDISGQDIPYNPAHIYRILFTGQGKTVHIAIQGPHGGMHGALRVRIYDASIATTALISPPCLPTPGGTMTATNPPPPVSYPPPAPTTPTSGTPPPPVATNIPPTGSSCGSWPAAPGTPGGPITTATSAPPGTGQPAPPAPPTGQPPVPPVATNVPPSGASCGSLPAAPGTPGGPVMTATSSPPGPPAPQPVPPTTTAAGQPQPPGVQPATPLTPEPSFLPTGPDITITSVNPAQAAPNTDLQATITGTNFPGDAVIGFENLAIQIESLTIVSPTQAKIRFKVPPDATTGATFVYMTTPDGRMAEAPFTVAPTITASNPSPPAPTSPATNGLKLLGTSLKGYGGPKINAALCKTYCDKDSTCVGWTYVKPTSACSLMSTITERRSDKCCISGEKPGSAATSAAVPLTPEPSFLPTGPDITITSVNPAQAAPNTDLQATVTGTNFPGDAVIGFENLAIQIESLTIVSPTQAKIRFKVPPDAATGATFVYMTTPDGRIAEAPFTVTPTATASNNPPNPPSQPATTHVPVSLGPANRGNCNPYSPSLEPVEPSAPSSAPATNPGAGPTTHVPVSIGPANNGTSNPPAPTAPAPTTHVPASLTPANPPPPSPPSPQPQPSTPANQTAPNNPRASAPAQPPPSQPNENPQPQQQQPNNWLGPLVQALGGIVQGMNQGQQTSPAAAGMNAADGVNLPGYDYTGYSLPQQGWDYCQSLCAQDQNCRAFTYVKPGVQAQEGRCWLKTNYSQVVRDGCCISGVKNTSYSQPQCQPHVNQPQTSETIGAADGVNLPGSDYVWYPLSQPRWDYCQSLCAQDQRCRAFTYVKPGVQGPQARCWLKSAVPQAVRDGCCISGAKSAPAYSYPQPQASPQPPRQTGCGPRTSQPAPAPNPRPPQTAPAPRATRVRIKVIAGVSCSPDDQYTSGFPGVTVNISGAAVTTGSDGVARFGQNPGEGIPPGTYRLVISAPRNARIVYVRLHMTSDSGIGNIIPPAGDGSYVLSFANVSNPNSMSEYELAIRFSSPDACRSGCR